MYNVTHIDLLTKKVRTIHKTLRFKKHILTYLQVYVKNVRLKINDLYKISAAFYDDQCFNYVLLTHSSL